MRLGFCKIEVGMLQDRGWDAAKKRLGCCKIEVGMLQD